MSNLLGKDLLDEHLANIEFGWESPIKMLHRELEMKFEDGAVKAVQNVGFDVDKEELLKALQYDRDQYNKGYDDAMRKFKTDGRQKFLFGDIVVVDGMFIGVVLKTWEDKDGFYYEIYVRSYNQIKDYREENVERYRVRHKELNDEELSWQNG